MGKRGRPRHPDVLTPREWAVLGLVRDGLSNVEIAERLSISLDGVKYHVSEILGKLGVDNRTDAARWVEEPSRPRAWSVALAPLAFVRQMQFGWLSGVAAAATAAAVVATITVLIWALAASGGDGVEPAPAQLEGLTADNFALRVREAMAADGTVFHVVSDQYQQSGSSARTHAWTVEAWIDFAAASAREEFTLDPNARNESTELPARHSSVAVDDTEYSSDGTESSSGPVQSCTGVTLFIAITLPLLCDAALDEASLANAALDIAAAYEGTPAVSLTVESEVVGSDPQGNETRIPLTVIYYADRGTLLPLARVSDYSAAAETTRQTDTYRSELISRDTLAGDFFDPASIGYVTPTPTPVLDPLAGLSAARDAGVTPYWLGEDLVDSDVGSALHFKGSSLGEPSGEGPGYRVGIEYEAVSAFREGGVSIWIWTRDDWQTYDDEAVRNMAFYGPCGVQQIQVLPGGTATFISAHEAGSPPATPSANATAPPVTPTPLSNGCPSTPFDRFAAIVDYGDTVVTINMPHCVTCLERSYDRDPWDSLDGMLAVVHALRVWPAN